MNKAVETLNVVSAGGGKGQHVTLKALKSLTDKLTAIVTMFDSGGSSGLFRREFGYPPMGDLRNCLEALSSNDERSKALSVVLGYRFPKESSLNGHPIGNLLLASLIERSGSISGAINIMLKMLNIKGDILPVTLENAELHAHLSNGTVIKGEVNIDQRLKSMPAISHLTLDHTVKANPKALEKIKQADAIILGPGDLHTSVIPNLLPEGMVAALEETNALICYVCNLMTKPGETDGYTALDFMRTISDYLGKRHLNYLIVNDPDNIPTWVLNGYKRENAVPVSIEQIDSVPETTKVIVGDLIYVDEKGSLHHHIPKLSTILSDLLVSR